MLHSFNMAVLRMIAAVSSAVLASALSVNQAGIALRSSSFVKPLEFQRRLRVCNAYPRTLDVFTGRDQKLTSNGPMAYKECRDFQSALEIGDRIEFKADGSSAGTFAISELPNTDAVLLLVVHRHDAASNTVAFESHVFSNLKNAQVAVIDAYKGSAHSKTRIMDVQTDKKAPVRAEELRFDSVVAVAPGSYEVELAGTDGKTKAKSSFVALDHESYVVLRTGVEAQGGASVPEDLVVYPRSDARNLHSGAASSSALVACVLATLALACA